MSVVHGQVLRNELSSSLLDLCGALTRLANTCLDDPPSPGSRAAVDQSDPANGPGWRGPLAVRNTYEDIHFILLAGVDHASALAKEVRRDDAVSVSLASLARGCIEALGRVFWVINGEDALHVVERISQIAHADLEDLKRVRPGESLGTLSRSKRMTPAEMQQNIVDFLSAHGLPKPTKPTARRLTTSLLDVPLAGLPEGAPRAAYSDLSAVAHGHPFAVTGFIDLQHQPTTLRIPEELMAEYTAIAHTGMVRLGNAYVDYFQPTAADADRWNEVVKRSSMRRARANLGQ